MLVTATTACSDTGHRLTAYSNNIQSTHDISGAQQPPSQQQCTAASGRVSQYIPDKFLPRTNICEQRELPVSTTTNAISTRSGLELGEAGDAIELWSWNVPHRMTEIQRLFLCLYVFHQCALWPSVTEQNFTSHQYLATATLCLIRPFDFNAFRACRVLLVQTETLALK